MKEQLYLVAGAGVIGFLSFLSFHFWSRSRKLLAKLESARSIEAQMVETSTEDAKKKAESAVEAFRKSDLEYQSQPKPGDGGPSKL